MVLRLVAVCFLAFFGNLVSARPELSFPENARSNSPAPRIVSGWEAEEGQIPHQISIRMVNSIGTVSSCGGSVIHNEWGITAAHCTATRPTIVVRAGLVNLTRPEFIFETTTWFNHPLYNNALPSVVQPHDIALLKFERFIPYSDFIKPIRLQSSEDAYKSYQGNRLTASGWGVTWTAGSAPEHLNWVYLLGVSNFDCWVAYGFSPIIVDSTICASAYNVSSQSTCNGDSGGPLTVVEDDGELSMVGVASFVSGTGCHTNVPAGFIRTGPYHDWFTEVTGLNFDPSRPSPTEAPEESSEEDITTTAAPEESSEEDLTTTAAPEESSEEDLTTTAAPEESSEEDLTTTATPKESSEEDLTTTAAPEESSEEDLSTVATPKESSEEDITTTAAPEESSEEESGSTTVAPEESSEEESGSTTAAPEDSSEEEGGSTTAAPEDSSEEESGSTTAAPEDSSEEESGSTTAAPENSSEEDFSTSTSAE